MSGHLILNDAELRSPVAFETWVRTQRRQGLSTDELGQRLCRGATSLTLVRGAQLLAYSSSAPHQPLLTHLSRCLLSEEIAVRCYARIMLAAVELQDNPQMAACLMPALLEARLHLRASLLQDTFVLEVEGHLLNILSAICVQTQAYAQGQAFASEGLLLSRAIGTSTLTNSLRLNYALLSLRLGQTAAAQATYNALLADEHAGPNMKRYAQLNLSALSVMHGEIQSALTQFTGVEQSQPSVEARVGIQYVQALSARLPQDEPVLECPDHNYDGLTRSMQLLHAGAFSSKPACVAGALQLLRVLRPGAESLMPVRTWLQTVGLLRQGKPFLAAQRIGAAQPVQPLIQVLVQAAKVDIALHFNGVDIEPLEALVYRLAAALEQLPSREARETVAELLLVWHPRAAAFLAVSPCAIPEITDVALPAIFVDGRPIHVYGQAVPSRLPFLQLTLEAFGVPAQVGRDQSAEYIRLDSVVLTHREQNPWRRPIVPPAQLIYHLIRVGERAGPLWGAAARELARSHGTVPTTMGGYLRSQRTAVHGHLEALLSEQISSGTFRSMVFGDMGAV
ncbi:hypothetical protein IHN32_06780 [Deinococcus sp. 14RED07]|uniref:hypothetical protein n=1 Tax=Deinococcus sp. 14RED07 TaxID=2745874 RepID=UPI001E543733|nr:hypothetical protein [Deinococcus sp. 14RED07]MCD0175651.1 hypothetical protein [Deinococcus sp. 14RED07]